MTRKLVWQKQFERFRVEVFQLGKRKPKFRVDYYENDKLYFRQTFSRLLQVIGAIQMFVGGCD